MCDAENTRREHPVYELWDDEELRWVEVDVPSVELAAFLEAWCEKYEHTFRRRPFGRRSRVTMLSTHHPIHGRIRVEYSTGDSAPF